jgi:hypothetical protein
MNKLLLFIFILAGSLLGEEPPKVMTKVEVILHSTDAPDGSFAAKPKVFYRAGNGYCRIEEAVDSEHGLHNLMIVNEPDYWMVNLITKTAKHNIDPGPTFNCHLPVFAYGTPQSLDEEMKEIRELEFGRELEFFKDKGAVPEQGPVLFKKETTSYKAKVGTAVLTLFVAKSPELPVAVSLRRGDENQTFLYSLYARTEFDPKLFAKPENVRIEDSKH